MQHARYQDLGARLALRHLWTGLGIEVVSTRWSRARHPERSRGVTRYFAVELMRAGAFEKRQGRRSLLADPGVAVFYNPQEDYEIRHPIGHANAGTTLRLEASALEAIRVAGGGPRVTGDFRRASAASPASLLLAMHRLSARLAALDTRAAEPLAVEEDVLAVVAEAVGLDAEGHDQRPPPAAAERRARIVREFLNESFTRPIRLADVAAAAGCSVWHAARQFRQATGSTIHAYLLQIRLRHALEELRQHAEDLTRLALDLGFSSHSHFTAAFHAEFGLTPREARRALSVRARSAARRR